MACRVVVLLLLIAFAGCNQRPNNKNSHQENISEVTDSTLMFDGRSLSGWEITNFGPQGPVSFSGDEIILGMGDGCTGITWKKDFPATNYEVSLDARRIAGNDFFCGMTFPVGKDPCTLIVGGWGGTTVGLSCIDGLDASENITTRLMEFRKEKWYHISLEVAGNEIIVFIDSVKIVDFKIGKSKLSIRPEVELSRPFGIASWNTTAGIRNITVTTK